jgi:hypothetical protein
MTGPAAALLTCRTVLRSALPAGAPGRRPSVSRVTQPAEYEEELVVAQAQVKDPGLPDHTARELAVLAWDHLRDIGSPDAPEVARRLLAGHPRAGATAANVVARAASEHVTERGLLP